MNRVVLSTMWRSRKCRFIIRALIFFLINIWSLTAYFYWELRDDVKRVLGEQQFSVASLIAEDLDNEFRDRIKALELVASFVDAPLLNNPALLQVHLEQRPVLQIFFNTGIFVTRLDGTAIAEVPLIGRVGLNYMDKDHIAAVLKDGKATIGKPVLGKRVLAPSFAITVPILDLQGKVIGALAGVDDLTKPNFLDKVMNAKFGATGGFLIVAPQYRLIVTASDKMRSMEVLPAAGISDPIDRMLNGYEGSAVFINARGAEVMNSAKIMPVSGWRVVVSVPAKDAFAPIHETGRRILLVGVILTLLGGTLAWWILRHQLSLTLSNNELAIATNSLLLANDELTFHSEEKGKRAAELAIANIELAYQIGEKADRAAELVVAKTELVYQNEEKADRAAELAVANTELAFQAEEKGKRADELAIANAELAFQTEEKANRADELAVANTELAFQTEEKGKRAAELIVANVEQAKDKKKSEEVWKLSFYDPLTNLPNRRLLDDRITKIMAASKRNGSHAALMMLDLDNFKTLNDLHGHLVGDLLLVEVGRRLMACVREMDTVARFGGDEFVVVLGELDADRVKSTEQARDVAEKVCFCLSQPYLLKVQSAGSLDRVIEHRCSASVGVVVFFDHELSQDDVLKLADAAMYQAKAAGRNAIRFQESSGQL